MTDETGEAKLNIARMKQTIKIKREVTHSLRPTLRHVRIKNRRNKHRDQN